MKTDSEGSTDIVALIEGKPFTEIPTDLFIPPDALEILMDSFSGPLDLLLYLIRRQNIDILNIPMATITQQYMQYIQFIEHKRLELAADYLVMAAVLIEIKSRLLLPKSPQQECDDVEEDPRMALVRQLQAYEQFKEAALLIDNLPRYERDVFPVQVSNQELQVVSAPPVIQLTQLVNTIHELMQRNTLQSHHLISREPLSVRERMSHVLNRLHQDNAILFTQLFDRHEGRMGLVVTLLAILELSRQSLLVIIQTNPFSPLHLKGVAHE